MYLWLAKTWRTNNCNTEFRVSKIPLANSVSYLNLQAGRTAGIGTMQENFPKPLIRAHYSTKLEALTAFESGSRLTLILLKESVALSFLQDCYTQTSWPKAFNYVVAHSDHALVGWTTIAFRPAHESTDSHQARLISRCPIPLSTAGRGQESYTAMSTSNNLL